MKKEGTNIESSVSIVAHRKADWKYSSMEDDFDSLRDYVESQRE